MTLETKLTLRMRKDVIERAKEYAKANNASLSGIVESYLDSLTNPSNPDLELTHIVKSLSGVIHLSPEYDAKKEFSNHVTKSHL